MLQFWTHAFETPQSWLDALAAFKAQRFVRRVFLLAIPTARVLPEHVAKGYHEVHLLTSRGVPTACRCVVY